ncbi:MAG: pyruvate/2-oxoglutarate/acetoin dehydrogenase E1 component/TPP-dependent pyruvate [Polaribacter sp.]|jgi:pyruvate/2-oxoglutarate/acetoin dehydrogenase E1 component/TPP-dependent pyruvate/acetoin dehydrogenase alpha subunit
MSKDFLLEKNTNKKIENSLEHQKDILSDYHLCCLSREVSIMARREVLTGKAKFGIIGDGKELPQLAMSKVFQKGDWRSGYYRDQTVMMALDVTTIEQFFAQLYADTYNDPFSGGRQMNSHYATPTVDENGEWTNHLNQYNTSSDISSTGGQMARGLGLAFASKKYRELSKQLGGNTFSEKGNEVCFVTIGDASTSEGVFWETINAAGVLQVPMVVSVWDDGYGISVPKEIQTTKGSISKVLEGFRAEEEGNGIDIYNVKGWDYPALLATYKKAIDRSRKTHIPALIHVEELTQQTGHSTSGSHERYKSKDRLTWEKEYDCNLQFRNWIVAEGVADEETLKEIEEQAKIEAKEGKNNAWAAYLKPVNEAVEGLSNVYSQVGDLNPSYQALFTESSEKLAKILNPTIGEIVEYTRRLKFELEDADVDLGPIDNWLKATYEKAEVDYHSNLYNETVTSAMKVPEVPAVFSETSVSKNGYEILNAFFDKIFEKYNNVFAFGEDVGHIGDVNQGFAGIQEKYGIERVFDTGIREWSIMGQAIGMALRGLRPIAEIQYLDYLIYGLQPLTDDLATLHYRTDGIQLAPAIIRTRGHRLEGIWHSGSPMGMIINSLRGMHICVPRNMTQAAGMYSTLLQANDPAIVIECLNGYRLKEKMPDNLSEFTVPLGEPEVLQKGTDVTLVTYGSCIRIAQAGIKLLEKKGISVELIDVQTLLPFDVNHRIVASLKKTTRIVFMDEDVPGGATAYMMQEVMEKQKGFFYLDASPTTISAKAHRPPYGSDGDYFTKPNAEDVCEVISKLVKE